MKKQRIVLENFHHFSFGPPLKTVEKKVVEMSPNFDRLHEISNEAFSKNFSILSQKLANPLLYPALHFLIGIPFFGQKHSLKH